MAYIHGSAKQNIYGYLLLSVVLTQRQVSDSLDLQFLKSFGNGRPRETEIYLFTMREILQQS